MENNEEKKVEEKQEEAQQVVVESPTEAITTNENMKMEPVQEAGTEEVKPKKKGKGLIIVIIILLIIAVATSVVYILFFSKTETKKVDNTTKEVKSEYRMTGNNIQNFDLYFAKIENKEANVVYSPLSIKYALEMLSEGADENTKAEIDAVIGEYTAKKYENNEHMSFANAMFIRDTFKEKVNADYKDILSNKYNADIIYDSFKDAKPMNDWVSNKTFKLINGLVTPESVAQENFILINALAIDMSWKNQIDCYYGSINTVPCYGKKLGEPGEYRVVYSHEKISDEEVEYHAVNNMYLSDEDFPGITFNNIENIKTGKVLADINRYDAVKEIGEEKIRSEVGEAYKKWLKSEDGKNLVSSGFAEPDVNKYLDQYIKELNDNYGKEDSSTDFYIYDDKNVKVFAKDLQEYNSLKLQYVGIMPKEKDLNTYIKDTDAKELQNIVKNLKELKKENFKDGVATIITGNIPFFKYEYELSLMKDLNKLGIKDVFDPKKANLTKMVKEDGQFISDAKHKATIEFTNEGIKAAATTAVEGGATSGPEFNYLYKIPVEKIDITFDKPYMYLIRDKESGEVWFVGTVYEPTKK